MASKKTRPVVGKLITSGHRSGAVEVGTSPRTPFEFKVLSPTGIIINRDMGGVGLAIVAALENSGDNFPAKKPTFCCRSPVPANNPCLINDDQEEYTIVTCHKPNESYTKIYHGGCVYERVGIGAGGVSPANGGSGFLSLCDWCKKKLDGKDIYMYRGEKAYCSSECRCRQMVIDERREKEKKCRPSVGVSSSSSCTNGQMFSTGIFVN